MSSLRIEVLGILGLLLLVAVVVVARHLWRAGRRAESNAPAADSGILRPDAPPPEPRPPEASPGSMGTPGPPDPGQLAGAFGAAPVWAVGGTPRAERRFGPNPVLAGGERLPAGGALAAVAPPPLPPVPPAPPAGSLPSSPSSPAFSAPSAALPEPEEPVDGQEDAVEEPPAPDPPAPDPPEADPPEPDPPDAQTPVQVGFSGGHDSKLLHVSGLAGEVAAEVPTEWVVLTPLDALGTWPASEVSGAPVPAAPNPFTPNPFAPRPAPGPGGTRPQGDDLGMPKDLLEELLGPARPESR